MRPIGTSCQWDIFFGNLDACGGLDDFCGLNDFCGFIRQPKKPLAGASNQQRITLRHQAFHPKLLEQSLQAFS